MPGTTQSPATSTIALDEFKRNLGETIPHTVLAGLLGAGVVGGLTAAGGERKGEKPAQRTARIMRNAFLGGVGAAAPVVGVQGLHALGSATRLDPALPIVRDNTTGRYTNAADGVDLRVKQTLGVIGTGAGTTTALDHVLGKRLNPHISSVAPYSNFRTFMSSPQGRSTQTVLQDTLNDQRRSLNMQGTLNSMQTRQLATNTLNAFKQKNPGLYLRAARSAGSDAQLQRIFVESIDNTGSLKPWRDVGAAGTRGGGRAPGSLGTVQVGNHQEIQRRFTPIGSGIKPDGRFARFSGPFARPTLHAALWSLLASQLGQRSGYLQPRFND